MTKIESVLIKYFTTFATFEDEDGKYWKKVLGETSKNHRLDSEDLRKGGLIIYEPNAYNPGYNGGEYFEL